MELHMKGVVGAALAVFMLASACSSDYGSGSADGGQYGDGSESAGYGDADSSESHDGHDGSGEGRAVLETVDNASLGEVLSDGDGNIVYLFTDDAPNQSTCVGDCAENWPPLRTTADADAPAELADGLSPELLGSIPREDGDPQVTYGDWPLYTYTGDAAPGDVNGQGVGSAWFVLASDGRMVTATAANPDVGAADDGEDDDGGYGGDYRRHSTGG